MAILDRIVRRLERYAVPNLTGLLIAGQVIFYVAGFAGVPVAARCALIPRLALEGEWWRFATFLFIPPQTNPVFACLGWYLFYFMGNAVEARWGAFRYDLFLLAGCTLTLAAAFAAPVRLVTNIFLGGSVFLAFAFLYPDLEINLFFILPVRMRWLAWLSCLGYGWELLAGDGPTRLCVLASLGNVLLFFRTDILWVLRAGSRHAAPGAQRSKGKEAFHRCAVCGITDLSHPTMDFRYCPECGGLCYCRDHLPGHKHAPISSRSSDLPS